MNVLAIMPYQQKVLKALNDAVNLQIGVFILVGDKTKIIEACYQANININKFQIHHFQLDIDAVDYARRLFLEKEVDYLLFGDLPEMYQIKIFGLKDVHCLGNIDIVDLPLLRYFIFIANYNRKCYPDFEDKKSSLLMAEHLMRKLNIRTINASMVTSEYNKSDQLETNIVRILLQEQGSNIEFNYHNMKEFFSQNSSINIFNANVNLLIMRNFETSRVFVNTVSAFVKARIASLICAKGYYAIDTSHLTNINDIVFSLLILSKITKTHKNCLRTKNML